MSETIEVRRKRLLFRSEHRGMKEMDIFLGRFARAHLAEMSSGELDEYEGILGQLDIDLYNWLTKKQEIPANLCGCVMDKVMAFNSSF